MTEIDSKSGKSQGSQNVPISVADLPSNGLSLVANSSLTDLVLLIEYLHEQLPHSSSLFHIVKGVANGEVEPEMMSNFYNYTDDILDPQFVANIRVKPGEISCCLHCSGSLNTGHIEDLAKILAHLGKKLSKHICFMALSSKHLGLVKASMAKEGGTFKWLEPAALFCLRGALPEQSSSTSLPDGYWMSDELTEADLVVIDSTWKYRSAHSLDMIKKMVASGLPCIGIKTTSSSSASSENTLVAWVMTYGDRSIGMMYTLESHRNKGLGKAVARAAIERFQQLKEGSDPFCYIVDGNEASLRVYEQGLNFSKIQDTIWSGFEFD